MKWRQMEAWKGEFAAAEKESTIWMAWLGGGNGLFEMTFEKDFQLDGEWQKIRIWICDILTVSTLCSDVRKKFLTHVNNTNNIQ